MHWTKLNLIGALVFIVGFLFGFIVDTVILGIVGNNKIFNLFAIISLVISFILFLKGTTDCLLSFNAGLNKILLAILVIFLSSLQILICYFISVILMLYIIGPIMIKLGYRVIMP